MNQGHFLLYRASLAVALLSLMGSIGCQGGQPAASDAAKETPHALTIRVTSTAFTEGQPIPKKYTGDGDDVSPPLAWSNLPKGAKELALICDDPDAPSPQAPAKEPWVHWVIYKIPADATGLPEGVPRELRPKEPAGAMQGANSWGKESIGYRGPKPPVGSGTHRYFFKLYALDAPLSVEPGSSKAQLLKAMEGHRLAEGQLMGTRWH